MAESFAHVRPQRLTVAIREPLRVVELLQRRQAIVIDGVAQPHAGIGVDTPDRQVLGHALGKPQRQQRRGASGPTQNIPLKRVDELVTQHVIGLAQARAERQHDAAAVVVGETANALRQQIWNDRRLGELRVAGVEHNRRSCR